MKSKSAEKIKLTSYDELFGAEENNVDIPMMVAKRDSVSQVITL